MRTKPGKAFAFVQSMLAFLGASVAECESGRLVEEISVARYVPSCCGSASYVFFDDLTPNQVAAMRGKYVTVAPQTYPSMEMPTSTYLITNGMILEYGNNGTRAWQNETAGVLEPHLHISYSNYPADYPPNEPNNAVTNYSIGANRNEHTYNSYTSQSGPALLRLYVNECNFPPSVPPHPPSPISPTPSSPPPSLPSPPSPPPPYQLPVGLQALLFIFLPSIIIVCGISIFVACRLDRLRVKDYFHKLQQQPKTEEAVIIVSP